MAQDKTPLPPKLLLGLILLFLVIAIAWVTYLTVRQPAVDVDEAGAAPPSPESQMESPSPRSEGEPLEPAEERP